MKSKKYETCWWHFNNKCLTVKCWGCLFYLPILKGQINDPDFDKFKKQTMLEKLLKVFEEIKSGKIKKVKKKKPVPKVSEETAKLMLDSLRELKEKINTRQP